jgi:hypothetical protein
MRSPVHNAASVMASVSAHVVAFEQETRMGPEQPRWERKPRTLEERVSAIREEIWFQVDELLDLEMGLPRVPEARLCPGCRQTLPAALLSGRSYQPR